MSMYEFKSNGTSGICNHTFRYDENIKIILLWRLINKYNLTLNKESFETICNEFKLFIEEQHELNKKGENLINHYSTIDIEAELLQHFEFIKFKNYE